MASPKPDDRTAVMEALTALDEAIARLGIEPSPELRIRMLEGAAALVGGYHLAAFDNAVGQESNPIDPQMVMSQSVHLTDALREGPLDPSLALACLGDFEVDPITRRRTGRYFTDSRLALELVMGVRGHLRDARTVLDPSCGAGILLVASALVAKEEADRAHKEFVGEAIWGVDRDALAVRAARAAISSLTNDVQAIAKLNQRLLVADSLASGLEWWRMHSPAGFDLVIGNPPWEKLKVTKHEHSVSIGQVRHYGAGYSDAEIDEDLLVAEKKAASDYGRIVKQDMAFQGTGEPDLYKLFLELAGQLASRDGAISLLVPAGLIRNQSTIKLRRWIFRDFDTDIVLFDNRRRFFEIDSRFKFLRISASRRKGTDSVIRFSSVCSPNGHDVRLSSSQIETTHSKLSEISPDLSLPEVAERADWDLFAEIRARHPAFAEVEAGWHPRFHREVDMTSDRSLFRSKTDGAASLPLIEGRMVHQHRVAAKRYVSGEGRRALWQVQPPFSALIRAQWFISDAELPANVLARTRNPRAGFCDITGQTNERTVLAALVPAGVVCGNKVPTIDFASPQQSAAWVGIANSFVFDWLARRSVTTTLNFFIMKNLPIPRWDPGNEDLRVIAAATQTLAGLEGRADVSAERITALRAEIEVRTALVYGIAFEEFLQMFRDFPQVDREQPPLPTEAHSTVTLDTIIAASPPVWAETQSRERSTKRVDASRRIGAVAFVPNEHARAERRPHD